MYDRILVPTDGSPSSEVVATHAAELAAAAGATLSALHVMDESTYDVDVDASAAVRDARREAGERALEEVAAVADEHGVEVNTELRRGVPDRSIVDYADEVDADLIAMGTHGRRGLERYLLGSVTEHVLRAADQPVLAVKLGTVAVSDADAAERAAREALAEEEVGIAGLREAPYRERSTWIVPITTEDGGRVNVHVDGASGETRIARLD
jgi:nucleotide-binding universal stress UspA family protein